MLLHQLFLPQSVEPQKSDQGTRITSVLQIAAGHPVFEGHFPGQPVMPGVCMMQAMVELCEHVEGKRYRLKAASSLKFLTVLNPTMHPTVCAEIDLKQQANSVVLKARLFWEGTVFFKMEGEITAH